jgi:hypothetical protein
MDSTYIEQIFESLAQSGRSGRLLLVVGSGLSKDYGLPSWTELASAIAQPTDNLNDQPAVFSNYVKRHGKRAFHNYLEGKLGKRPADIYPVTRLLLEIRCAAIVTTNADRIIETAANHLGKPIAPVMRDTDLEDYETGPWFQLIKFHGSLDDKDTLVFTQEEYDSHDERIPGIRYKLAELLRSCQTVCLGYSLADTDFADLMSLASAGTPDHMPSMIGLFSKEEIAGNWRRLYLDAKIRTHVPLVELPFDYFGSTHSDAIVTFLARLREAISPQTLPQLERQTIIMLHGYTACLKTETATYLSNCFSIPLIATHRYGSCTTHGLLDLDKRKQRYEILLQDAELQLGRGYSIVLDGTFSEPEWRERVYELAAIHRAHVVAIKATCDDSEYIKARLWQRRVDHSRSDHEVTDFQNYVDTRLKILSNPITGDPTFVSSGYELITFDTNGNRQVEVPTSASHDAQEIARLIRLSHLMSKSI